MTCTLLCKLSSSVAGRSKQNSNVVLMVCSFIFGRLQDKARPHVAEGKWRLYFTYTRPVVWKERWSSVTCRPRGQTPVANLAEKVITRSIFENIQMVADTACFWVGDRCLGTKGFCTPAIKAQLWRRTLKPINYTVRFYASFPCSFIFI